MLLHLYIICVGCMFKNNISCLNYVMEYNVDLYSTGTSEY